MLVGDSGVGKTCLLVRFKDGAFLAGTFISTVGIDFRVRVEADVLSTDRSQPCLGPQPQLTESHSTPAQLVLHYPRGTDRLTKWGSWLDFLAPRIDHRCVEITSSIALPGCGLT